MRNPLNDIIRSLRGSMEPAAGAVSAQSLTNEQIAQLLGSSPEALTAFTSAYQSFEESRGQSENFFAVTRAKLLRLAGWKARRSTAAAEELITRITAELAETQTLALEAGNNQETTDLVTAAEIDLLPEPLRPQLTGSLAVKDIDAPAYPAIVALLDRALSANTDREHQQLTLQAMAMMDTLDLDPVTYQMLSLNPAAMSKWLGPLQKAVDATGFFKIPETRVAQVPLPILQMTRLEFGSLTPATLAVIDRWAQQAFELDPSKQYFIKTGTYSSKFDFRNARVTDPHEVLEIGQYLTYIHHQANQMASPLNQTRPIAGVSTTNEWVVREWIENKSDSPAIYHGMPLRTEFRVFVDCDANDGSGKVLAVAPYWDPEVMLERFEQQSDAQDPDMRHDAIVFRAHLPVLMERFERFKDTVSDEVAKMLPALDLTGQWSLDVMLNDDEGTEFYAIDMAPAATSALSHHVPAGLLHMPRRVNWLPQLGGK